MPQTFKAPATYRAAAFMEKGGQLHIIDVPWKDPYHGQIVIKVLACGICHSDLFVKHQTFPTGLPRIPGHEIVGQVVAIPSSEKHWKMGQRVGAGWHGGHCHLCDRCRAGDFLTCQNEAISGIGIDGGYAEYATLRTEAVIAIPEDLNPAEAAPLLCAGITMFNSLRHMNVRPGEIVAIQGIGGLGHIGLQFARAMGFHTVALSSSAAKEELALSLGAHTYIDGSTVDQAAALQELGGAKAVLCTAPDASIMQALVGGLAVDGTLVILAVAQNIEVPCMPVIQKRLSVRGWPVGTPRDCEQAFAFSRTAGVKCYVECFPLERCNEAFERMENGEVRFRSVLVF